MERQVDNEFRYIENLTIEDLEKTINKKDLENFGEYSTKMIKSIIPMAGQKGYEFYTFGRAYMVSDGLEPKNL